MPAAKLKAFNDKGIIVIVSKGFYAAFIAYSLSKKYNVVMLIIEERYKVLYENRDINSVVSDLMKRPTRTEHK